MALKLDITPTNTIDRILSKVRRTLRDVERKQLRKRMVDLPACGLRDASQPFSVHLLICHRDLEMAVASAKSFVWACQQFFKFTFHDDGSLTEQDKELLLKNFPGAKLIDYKTSLQKAADTFGEDSEIYKMRLKGVMMLKLIDIRLFSDQPKAILLDSDIAFFEYPAALLDAVKDLNHPSVFNKDIDTAYMTDKPLLDEMCGKELPERINAGLSVLNTSAIDFLQLEQWLKELKHRNVNIIMHRIEQSLVAMLCTRSEQGIAHLPTSYDVSFFKDVHESVCKHYVGRIRHGFELEGLVYLFKEKHFSASWKKFIATNQSN